MHYYIIFDMCFLCTLSLLLHLCLSVPFCAIGSSYPRPAAKILSFYSNPVLCASLWLSVHKNWTAAINKCAAVLIQKDIWYRLKQRYWKTKHRHWKIKLNRQNNQIQSHYSNLQKIIIIKNTNHGSLKKHHETALFARASANPAVLPTLNA